MPWARTIRWVVPLVCLLPRGVSAQIPTELREAMRARDQAVAKADAATWDRLTVDDFTVVFQDGRMLTKAERLAEMKQQKPAELTPAEQEQVKRYGDTVVRRFRRTTSSGDFRSIEVWVKDAQGWRVAAVQLTSIPKK